VSTLDRRALAALALALLLWAVSFPVTRIALAGVLMVQMKGR
jgi:hypothetical protein